VTEACVAVAHDMWITHNVGHACTLVAGGHSGSLQVPCLAQAKFTSTSTLWGSCSYIMNHTVAANCSQVVQKCRSSSASKYSWGCFRLHLSQHKNLTAKQHISHTIYGTRCIFPFVEGQLHKQPQANAPPQTPITGGKPHGLLQLRSHKQPVDH